jgi:hypothetical protein
MDAYKVKVPELTIHRQVGELTDPITGRVIGIQQGQGKTWFKDEVVPADAISPLYLEALEDEDNPMHDAISRKLEKVGSGEEEQNVGLRLGLPFAGYDDMDEEEILNALRHLPSATIQVVKEYEATVGEGRERILSYSIGFGESLRDREEGLVGSDLDEEGRDENKAVARLTTREVPEEGQITHGEGITGTGEPAVPYGTEKAGEGEDDVSEGGPSTAREGSQTTRRRSRRTRPTNAPPPAGSQPGDTPGAGGDKGE